MEIYNWLVSSSLPVMPGFDLKRSFCQDEIKDNIKEIKAKSLDVKLWMFKRYDQFENLSLKGVNVKCEELGKEDSFGDRTCNPNIFWIFGGVLNALPSVSNYRLVQVGIQINLNQTWQVLATTDTV